MSIVVITGSPHENGTSALLADKFIEGAEENGYDVFRFDAGFEEVAPCKACDFCRSNDGQCVNLDSMEKLNDKLLDAEVVVFVSPLYYFGMSAQIKLVIDRFYANNAELMDDDKETILLASSADNQGWTMKALENHYETIVKYLGWNDFGRVLATGCPVKESIIGTAFLEEAYKLGKKI